MLIYATLMSTLSETKPRLEGVNPVVPGQRCVWEVATTFQLAEAVEKPCYERGRNGPHVPNVSILVAPVFAWRVLTKPARSVVRLSKV